jgi:hypothetical protein
MREGFERHIRSVLPLVIQYVINPTSITEFLERHPGLDIHADVLFDIIHRAYNREDGEFISALLRVLASRVPYYIRISSFEKVRILIR